MRGNFSDSCVLRVDVQLRALRLFTPLHVSSQDSLQLTATFSAQGEQKYKFS
jgi:hypothetical protein